MRFLVNSFLKGCLVLVPTVATLYVVYWVFRTMDNVVSFGPPGSGLLLTLVMITGIGALASNVIGRRLFGLIERALQRVPLIKLLYGSLRDMMSALVGDKRSFDRPVVVTLTEHGAKAFGFVTQDDLHAYGLDEHVAVYFPQSINFAGHFLVFPRDRVRPLSVDSARFMAFVVSGGVTGHAGLAQTGATDGDRGSAAVV